MKKKKNVAIVAHDNRKKDIIEWVSFNWQELVQHDLICTGTTGKLVEETLAEKCNENNIVLPTITRLRSGPLGGDQQLGALIVDGAVDILIFFWDPMQSQPHDVDVKTLFVLLFYTIFQRRRIVQQPISLSHQAFSTKVISPKEKIILVTYREMLI